MTHNLNTTPGSEIIDEDVLRALLEHGASTQIPSDLNARLRARVLSITQNQPAAQSLVTIRAGEGDWVNIAPSVDIKILSDDATYRTMLYRFGAGGRLPAHAHRGDEECMVLEGEVFLGDIHVKCGDYHLARRGSAHDDLFSETGALLFVRHARTPRQATA